MTKTLFTNISSLVQTGEEFGVLRISSNAAVLVENGIVTWTGSQDSPLDADQVVDLAGQVVIPGFVDSHTHLIFAGDRATEFAHRMAGESYSAGGIRTTVAATRAATDDELRHNLRSLIAELYASGVTEFEIKSGYGLDVESEARLCAIAAEFTKHVTFLGAHVVPEGYSASDYVRLVNGDMLSAVLPHARYIDVFCDQGAFSVSEARAILQAGIDAGLKPRLHANQLANLGGVELGIELGCTAIDHCSHLTADQIQSLADSGTIVTLLPGAEFSTRSEYPDARALVQAGVKIALSTDCNPGSSFTTSMPLCVAIAVRDMGLSVDQAIWAATRGGAKALGEDSGSLAIGSRADFAVLAAPSHVHLAYRPGVQLVSATYVAGEKVYERN